MCNVVFAGFDDEEYMKLTSNERFAEQFNEELNSPNIKNYIEGMMSNDLDVDDYFIAVYGGIKTKFLFE